MGEAYICDGVRTPIGRYAGALSSVRTDDLAAEPLRALMRRHADLDWSCVDDVLLGCANQAGEDNRNVARMALLLAGVPQSVPGATVNRLCGSGMEAVTQAARTLRAGEAELMIAGGVESMSRAPFVQAKADTAFARRVEMHDTTLGWRFVNPRMEALYGTDSMAQTAENVAREFDVARTDQDAFAERSQRRAETAVREGLFAEEIVPVEVPRRRGEPLVVAADEHPRPHTNLGALAALGPIFGDGGTVTAGNAAGINDGACALLLASEAGVARHGLTPRARVVTAAVAGVAPRIMGMGPAPAAARALERAGLALDDMDVIELNEAFAAQALAVLRELGIADDAPHVNPNGGAIALGHPLGMSGARLMLTAMAQLHRGGGRYALCTMCIGVGQGIATIIERV